MALLVGALGRVARPSRGGRLSRPTPQAALTLRRGTGVLRSELRGLYALPGAAVRSDPQLGGTNTAQPVAAAVRPGTPKRTLRGPIHRSEAVMFRRILLPCIFNTNRIYDHRNTYEE